MLHPIWSRISIGMEWRGLLAKDGKEKKHLRMNVIIAARACDISKEQCPSLFTGKDQGEGGDGTTNDHSTTEPFLHQRVLPPPSIPHHHTPTPRLLLPLLSPSTWSPTSHGLLSAVHFDVSETNLLISLFIHCPWAVNKEGY